MLPVRSHALLHFQSRLHNQLDPCSGKAAMLYLRGLVEPYTLSLLEMLASNSSHYRDVYVRARFGARVIYRADAHACYDHGCDHLPSGLGHQICHATLIYQSLSRSKEHENAGSPLGSCNHGHAR